MKKFCAFMFVAAMSLGLSGCGSTPPAGQKDTPKVDAPKTDAPKADAPKTDAPKTEEKQK